MCFPIQRMAAGEKPLGVGVGNPLAQMAAFFLNGHPTLCRQGIQSFVDGGEHFRRFFRRFVQPMTEGLLFPRIEPKDGVLDFRELGPGERIAIQPSRTTGI